MMDKKLCLNCGKELSKNNKSGLCKTCFSLERSGKKDNSSTEDYSKFTVASPVTEVIKKWGSREIKIYVCPDCNARIWNPDTKDNFCYNCGRRLR